MVVTLQSVVKQFGIKRVLNNLSFEFPDDSCVAVTGPNGSGKSTLLKTISGMITPDSGTVTYRRGGQLLPVEEVWRHISFSAPYLELPTDFTVIELWRYHTAHRVMLCSSDEFLRQTALPADAVVRVLSSGMQQRLKLALAVFTKSELLLLDEPTSNFDDHWKGVYLQWMAGYTAGRSVIISSNEPAETAFCNRHVNLGA